MLPITISWIAIISIFLVFSNLIIQNFSSPLSGLTGFGPWRELNHDFVDLQEYNGFYFVKNLFFNPFPQLHLLHNQVFYPYGTNNVFNPWSFEANYFYALLYSFFGAGPWLQIYYLLSLLICVVGTIALLKREYGLLRAVGASLLVTFGNFYAIYKYPHHFQQSIIHWVTLSFIVDFLIVKKVVLRRPITLKILLIRSCLLFLLLGQDLGYMAGFGLTSFAVSLVFIFSLSLYRFLQKEFQMKQLLSQAINNYKKTFLASPGSYLILISINLVIIYLYFPLALQIAREAESFDFSDVQISTLWVNPLRILTPLIPGISRAEINFGDEFNDLQETSLDSTPGLFLVLLGAIALWQNRNQLTPFIPLLITFSFCLLYIPGRLFVALTLKEIGLLILSALGLWITQKRMILFVPLILILFTLLLVNPTLFLLPTLKLFPWFAFNRVAGRCTVVYPVILTLFALHIRLDTLSDSVSADLSVRKRQIAAGLLVGLACIELGTVYSFRSSYQHPEPLKADFFAYMNTVKQQPGEAVLDWPFCIASGGGAESICPYYFQSSGIFALRRFHQKKVMGQYFGRLHRSQVAPYFEAGWDKLFFQDAIDPTRQSCCFNQKEWSFFTDFFKFNDFAGINLYSDRLPIHCIPEFYTRFGFPMAETTIPGAGRVVFIPKSLELSQQVSLTLGKRLKFKP
ncbi:MAG: hypothetical protein DCF22_10660 [Leptolyngbya sp.]|nr:MAG: hypothetical protein DCF22_10660 [Leptolyngbya sp.]